MIRSKKLIEALGNPLSNLKAVHIAGTSGKGTTAMMLSRILVEHGFKVGLLLSPHVYDIRERYQINNQFIDRNEFERHVSKIMPIANGLLGRGCDLTHHEVATALGFTIFSDKAVDYAIIETGLGGKYDFTNLLDPANKVCLFTPIDLDHTDILGTTIKSIAQQKAGIIKAKNKVLSAPQPVVAKNTIITQANKQKASYNFVSPQLVSKFIKQPLSKLNNQLWGDHQQINASLALAACKYLSKRDHWQISLSKVKKAMSAVALPGRFEEIFHDKIFILDGAHNQQKINVTLQALKLKFPDQPFGIVLTIGEQKPVPVISGPQQIISTSYGDKYQDMPNKGMAPRELAKKLKLLNPNLQVKIAATPKLAVSRALESSIKLWLVTGSFFILKEMRDLLRTA